MLKPHQSVFFMCEDLHLVSPWREERAGGFKMLPNTGDDHTQWIPMASNGQYPILNYNWLVVWNMSFMTFHSVGNSNPNWRTHLFQRGSYYHIFHYGMSSFPLTNSYFSRWLKPPTSSAYLWFIDGIINGLLMGYGIWNHQPENSRADSSSGTSMEISRADSRQVLVCQGSVVCFGANDFGQWLGKPQSLESSPELLWFEWENPLEIHQKWRFLDF